MDRGWWLERKKVFSECRVFKGNMKWKVVRKISELWRSRMNFAHRQSKFNSGPGCRYEAGVCAVTPGLQRDEPSLLPVSK